MDKFTITALLQVCLWKSEGMNELQIRCHLAQLVKPNLIKAGISLFDYLNKISELDTKKNENKINEKTRARIN